jgi:hypothetical protein
MAMRFVLYLKQIIKTKLLFSKILGIHLFKNYYSSFLTFYAYSEQEQMC